MPMASAMSRNALSGSLKGKPSLAGDPLANTILQRSCRDQIHPAAKNVREPVLQTHHFQKRELLCGVKLGHQVDVRFGRRIATGDGTEER